MKVGDLVQQKTGMGEPFFAEIAAFWNKRDIDPVCPESVAIVPMVRLIILTGEGAGKSKSFYRRNILNRFLEVKRTA